MEPRPKMSVRKVRTFVRNARRGQLSSEWRHNDNDVIMRIAALVAGCERRRCEPHKWSHDENNVTMISWLMGMAIGNM